MAGDGRDEALAAQGEDELGVGQLEAAVQLHLLVLGVHRHHLALQDLDDVLGLIPPGGMQSHLVGGEAGEHGLGQHGPLVGGAFVGDEQDAARLVPLPDGLGRADAGAAVAQDDVGVLGIVAEGGLLHLYLHKLVPADAAHRAGVQRGVENLAAHQALDQLAGAGALLLLLLHRHVVLGADAAHRAALLVRLEHRAAHFAPHQLLLGGLLLPGEGDKVLGANLTDGTGLRVGVKHRAAHVAADLPLGSALDGMEVVQHRLGKFHAIFPGLFELVLAGLEAHPEALQGLELELLEALHDVGHALAAPAVAAEGGGHLAPVGAGKHAGGQVPDGLEGLTHDGGGAQQETVGVEELLSHFAGVGLHHVIQAHVDAALVRDTLGNGLGQLAGVAVGTDIGNNDGGPGVRIDDGGPLLVGIQHVGNAGVQHRAVAGADHLQLQRTHPLQSVQHKALEGADDAVVVILGGLPVALLVGNGAGQDTVAGVVGTEGVAGDQHLVLPDIGVHGVGPVEVGNHHELQSLVVQLQSLAVLDGDGVEIPIDDLFQKVDGAAGGHDLQPGVELQQALHAAAVVGLGVADHQIVHLVDGGDGAHLLQPAVQAFGLSRLKKDGMVGGFQHVGIVGGAVLGVHDDVKHPQVVIQGAGKIKTGLEFQNTHVQFSFVLVCLGAYLYCILFCSCRQCFFNQ